MTVQGQEGFTEGTEALVHVPTAGDQSAVVGRDVGKGTETIVLQLVNEISVVKRFFLENGRGGKELRDQLAFILPRPVTPSSLMHFLHHRFVVGQHHCPKFTEIIEVGSQSSKGRVQGGDTGGEVRLARKESF